MQVSAPFNFSYSSGISIHVEKLIVTVEYAKLRATHAFIPCVTHVPMCLCALRAVVPLLKWPHILTRITRLHFF